MPRTTAVPARAMPKGKAAVASEAAPALSSVRREKLLKGMRKSPVVCTWGTQCKACATVGTRGISVTCLIDGLPAAVTRCLNILRCLQIRQLKGYCIQLVEDA